jgi:hypothetical protein
VMDIITAFKYRECGYRIRRTAWALYAHVHPTSMVMTHLSTEDVLADDWELVTEGIIKDFPLTYSNRGSK